MGGANAKALSLSSSMGYDDPRSPSFKRTPITTPVSNWRTAAAMLAKAGEEDPRSPTNGVDRTPLRGITSMGGAITPLTLSYGDCLKMSYASTLDPRSPMGARTPLHAAMGIPFDTTVVSCGPFGDTVVVGEYKEENKTTTPSKLGHSSAAVPESEISFSGIINATTLSSMNIISASKEEAVVPTLKLPRETAKATPRKVEKLEPIAEECESIAKSDSLQLSVEVDVEVDVDLEVDGATTIERSLSCSTEEISKTEKVVLPPKLSKSGFISSPALLEREYIDKKRKDYPNKQLYGVSPLKKSFSSPACTIENNENELNNSPIRPSPPTPRRASLKTASVKGSRSPLSPLTPRSSKRKTGKLTRESSMPLLV